MITSEFICNKFNNINCNIAKDTELFIQNNLSYIPFKATDRLFYEKDFENFVFFIISLFLLYIFFALYKKIYNTKYFLVITSILCILIFNNIYFLQLKILKHTDEYDHCLHNIKTYQGLSTLFEKDEHLITYKCLAAKYIINKNDQYNVSVEKENDMNPSQIIKANI